MKNRQTYILLSLLVQSLLIYGLNHVHSIQWCALFFSLFTLHIFYVADKTQLKTAFGIHLCSILINLMIGINSIYYIHGQPIQGLYITSYLSVFLSVSMGLYIFSKRRESLSFIGGYFWPGLVTTLVDGLGMMLFFINLYTFERVLQIFVKEVSYKVLYTAAILAVMHGVRISMMKKQPTKGKISL